MPEVLLDLQMMSRSLDIQWIIKIPQISKEFNPQTTAFSVLMGAQPVLSVECSLSQLRHIFGRLCDVGVPGPGQAFPLWEAPCCMHQELSFQTEVFHPGSNPHLG